MKTSDIKRIMIVHNDNDFIRVWEWIGKTVIDALAEGNYCGESVLSNSEDIEKFIALLIPIGIEFFQYRVGVEGKRYREINESELTHLNEHLSRFRIKYNFDYSDGDWESGGAETLIIDVESKQSYTR
jgi:hypothetical protein